MPAAARREKSAERSGVQANGSGTALPCAAPGGVGTTGTFAGSSRRAKWIPTPASTHTTTATRRCEAEHAIRVAACGGSPRGRPATEVALILPG